MPNQKRFLSLIFLSLTTLIISLLINNFPYVDQPISAQALRPENVAMEIYERLDNFPLENQYLNQETGDNETNNTLIFRLIRYHQYIKRRPIQYRFDWKLTLADYLDANEPMLPQQYPGSNLLTENPFERDRQVIQTLTRQQRDQLVNQLVNIYNPQTARSNQENNGENQQNNPSLINLPESGAADLLKF